MWPGATTPSRSTCTWDSRGADRAVQVCDRLRPVLPLLLAISASSPFLDGRDSRAGQRPVARSSPRAFRAAECPTLSGAGTPLPPMWIPGPHQLDRRIHPGLVVDPAASRVRHGRGQDVRLPDHAQESEALAGLIVACVAQAARDIDEGVPWTDHPRSLIEENMWRAIRYGLDGELIDLERGRPIPAAEADRAAAEPGPSRPGPSWDSSRAARPATGPSASASCSSPGLSLQRGLRGCRGGDTRDVCSCDDGPEEVDEWLTRSGGARRGAGRGRHPTEEELRAAYEEQIKQIRVEQVCSRTW